MKKVYITKTAHFLPNRPVSNDDIEKYLGDIGHHHSRAKRIVLRNNKIINRHYAIDEEGHATHTNAEIATASINKLFHQKFTPEQLELLSVGTSSPDVLIPSHGLQIHSMINGVGSIPVYTSSGVCCSSMHALEVAYFSIAQEKASNAIASGSELASPILRSEMFEIEHTKLHELNENAIIAFEKDFLRFMLSDGSGAFLLQDEPTPNGINFEIEWIESISYANIMPPCMFQGCIKNEDDTLKSWKLMGYQEWENESVFSVKQDTRILENIIPKGVEFFKQSIEKRKLDENKICYFLPHISSMYFYNKLIEGMKGVKINIPEERYYCCLPEIGNIGSASIYATLDKLTQERTLNRGDIIILGVPESAQFQYSMACLKVT